MARDYSAVTDDSLLCNQLSLPLNLMMFNALYCVCERLQLEGETERWSFVRGRAISMKNNSTKKTQSISGGHPARNLDVGYRTPLCADIKGTDDTYIKGTDDVLQ